MRWFQNIKQEYYPPKILDIFQTLSIPSSPCWHDARGDDYSRHVADVFDDIVNNRRVVEDIVVFWKTFADHLELAHHLFKRANEYSVTIAI
jgi:hypothetical protein